MIRSNKINADKDNKNTNKINSDEKKNNITKN